VATVPRVRVRAFREATVGHRNTPSDTVIAIVPLQCFYGVCYSINLVQV
jgi:hypothetical protein